MDQQTSVQPKGSPSRPRDGHRDLTKGPILTTLLAFSAPTLASNILQALNGSVNSIWVGRLLGDSALAATANANVVMFLVFAAVFGFGMAATVKVGQAFGAGETDAARRTFGSAIGLCVGLSLIITPLGWIFTPHLLTAMSTPPEIHDFAQTYLRVIFVAMPASIVTVIIGRGLRGPELAYLIPDPRELRFIVTKGLPMGAQMLMISASGIIMIGLANHEGAMSSAAYGASLQVWTYLQRPAMAISAALSAMAAQSIGAGLIGRLGKITRAGLILNLTITGTLTLLLLAFDRPVLTLFLGPTSPSVDAARHIQFLASWSYVLFGVTIVLFGTMRAGGVVIAPIVVLGTAMYPIRLGFYVLAYPLLGPDALWLAFPVGSAAAVIMATIAYRRPGWRQHARVVDQDECSEETHADGECAGRMAPDL